MKWDVSIVAIVRDEGSYIQTWIDYHIALGIDHFIIYDNMSTDETAKILDRYINRGRVTLIRWPVVGGQIDAYNHAVRLFGPSTYWMGFLDIDEHLVLHQHDTASDFLASQDADQFLIPWQNFSYNGHERAPGGTSMENFLYAFRVPPGGGVQVKHFVRPEVVKRTTAHFSITNTRKTVIADGKASSETHYISEPTYKVAQINHYATRSIFENQMRLQKGQVSGSSHKRPTDFHPMTREHVQRLVYDRSIMRHLSLYRDEADKWRSLKEFPHRYGMLQRTPILTSWNSVIFYTAKSVANYIHGEAEVKPTAREPFIRVEAGNHERNITNDIIDHPGPAIHFRVSAVPHQRSFIGSVHYGDLLRRFSGCLIESSVDTDVRGEWSAHFKSDFSGYLAIFFVENSGAITVSFKTDFEGIKSCSTTVYDGQHCVIVYIPMCATKNSKDTFSISGQCRIHDYVIIRLH